MYRHPGNESLKRARLRNTCSSVLFCACLSLPFLSLAQQDSMRQEILKYTAPSNELIYRGRKMILDKIVQGDREKVRQVMTFLVDSTEDKDYLAFSPIEKWLLYYWSGQYDKILADARHFEAFLSQAEGRRVPIQDALMRDVMAKVVYERLKIQMDINATDLVAMQKAFLVLNLDYITENYATAESQQSINDACNGFFSLYPNTEFEPYIRKYIRHQYKASDWSYACELMSGYGVFTGGLSTKFTNPFALGIAADVGYKKFVLFLRVCGGFGLTRDSIHFSNAIWAGNASTSVTVPEASLGYLVYANKGMQVSPFAGISSILVSPSDGDKKKYPEYQHVGFQSMSYSLGMNLDFNLVTSYGSGAFGFGSDKSSLFVRVRYTYNHQLPEAKNARFYGNFHNLTIGIGLFGRPMKREY